VAIHLAGRGCECESVNSEYRVHSWGCPDSTAHDLALQAHLAKMSWDTGSLLDEHGCGGNVHKYKAAAVGRDTDPNNQLTLALEALVKESPQQRAAVVAEGRALVTLHSKLMRDVDLEARLQLLRKEAGARGERSC
jgi:hypothetical protein